MKIYIRWVCVSLLSFLSRTKSSENENNVNSILSSSEEKNLFKEKSSTEKKWKRYVNYGKVPAHSREMTAELDAVLTEKERILRTRAVHKWEDVRKYPLNEHKKYWDSFCGKLWPGIPGYIYPECISITKTLCVAYLFPSPGVSGGGKYFRGFRHDYDPEIHEAVLPFFGDFICCDCKYVQGDKKKYQALLHSHKYFFAMKIGEREYFLLRKLHKMDYKSNSYTKTMLKIVDYVNLPESLDINLNI